MKKYSKAKKYMLQYKDSLKHRAKIQKHIKELQGMLTDIGGFDYSKDKVLSSTNPNAPYVLKLEQLDILYRHLEDAEEDVKESLKSVGAVINKVKNDRSREILTKLYMQCLDWNDIFNHGEVAESTYYKYHNIALAEVDDIIKEQQWK